MVLKTSLTYHLSFWFWAEIFTVISVCVRLRSSPENTELLTTLGLLYMQVSDVFITTTAAGSICTVIHTVLQYQIQMMICGVASVFSLELLTIKFRFQQTPNRNYNVLLLCICVYVCVYCIYMYIYIMDYVNENEILYKKIWTIFESVCELMKS